MLSPHTSLDALLERLLPALTAALRAEEDEGIPRPIPLVVPSKQLADWLQTQIAARTGLCMGLEFLPPQEFIQRILRLESEAEDEVFESDQWSPDNLCWRMLPHMGDYAARLGLSEKTPPVRDLFALACLVADRFDQYTHFRPEMIRAWEEDRAVPRSRNNSLSAFQTESEAWQRELWQKLHREIQGLPSPQLHPALRFSRLAERGQAPAGAAAYPRLFVLGIGSLDPLLVELLLLLEKAGSEISTHVVLPSLRYLDDLRGQTELFELLKEDPELDPPSEGNPLLASLGRQAIGAFQLLARLDENFSGWDEEENREEEPSETTSLLARIQSDVRALRAPGPGVLPAEGDVSLRVHACHGQRREVEVLRDELLRAFQDLPGLLPEEILVVCSDLDPYAPLVEAILRRGNPPLPVRLTELPLSEKNPLTEALVALLDYAHGRWPASGLIELCHLRAVRSHLRLGDDEDGLRRLQDWIRSSGLTEEGPADQPETPRRAWQDARDRLIAGAWFGPAENSAYPDGRPLLPVTGSLDGLDTAKAAFLDWLLRLEQQLRSWRIPATPAVWSTRLLSAYEELLAGEDDSLEFPGLDALLRRLASQECAVEVDDSTLLDWLKSQFEEHSAARSSLNGDISVGRFRQLQHQPCRVLAMLGMQDGVFPRQSRSPAWDLLQLDPRRWDRNPRIEDRQLFLDALLTPRDRLIICAGVLNTRTGKREPFSACVDELLRASPAPIPVIEHRLYPFSPAYFSDASRLPRSFDKTALEIALALQGRQGAGAPQVLLMTPVEPAGAPPSETDLAALQHFWKDPCRGFLRAQGLVLPRAEDDDRDLDRPPLTLDALQEWVIKQRLLEAGLAGRNLPPELFAANRELPPDKLGRQHWGRLEPVARSLSKALRGLQLKDPLPVELSLAGGLLLHGSLRLGSHQGEGCLVAFTPGEFNKPRKLLGAWIEALAASASGLQVASVFVDEELHEKQVLKKTAPVDPGTARALLDDLVAGLLEGRRRPLCFAPETSWDYLSRLEDEDGPRLDKLTIAANTAWYSENGEGSGAAARLAWRDRNPFDEDTAGDWHDWAVKISLPLHTWWQGAAEQPL